MDFKIRIANLNIAISGQSNLIRDYCRDYLTEDGEIDVSVVLTPEDVSSAQKATGGSYSIEYLGWLAILWKIADQLPAYRRLLVHGAAITYGEKAYLFMAPSGTGKSTHILHWRRLLGERVGVVNGDKPILSFDGGEIRVHGTPWAGKEGWQRNRSAALHGVCVLHRGQENVIRRISPQDSVLELIKHIYLPDDVDAAGETLELLDQMASKVPIYELYCDKSEDAVRCSFEAMTGLRYERRGMNA